MSAMRSSTPLERDAAGHRIVTHGAGGYARGCGCEACTRGHLDKQGARREAARQATGRGMPEHAEDNRTIAMTVKLSEAEAAAYDRHIRTVPRSLYAWQVILRELGLTDTARRPARRSSRRAPLGGSGDWRSASFSVRISVPVAAELGRRLGPGQTRGRFVREMLLKDMGMADQDTVRRIAPRRPNYSKRAQSAG